MMSTYTVTITVCKLYKLNGMIPLKTHNSPLFIKIYQTIKEWLQILLFNEVLHVYNKYLITLHACDYAPFTNNLLTLHNVP